MKTLITICARKNSQRLPNKNMLPLCGRPLAYHTITQAKEWASANGADVIISTDIEELEDIAGVYHVRRPACRDDVGKIAQIRDAHSFAEHLTGYEYGPVIDLDVCNPMRDQVDITNAAKWQQENDYDVVVSVTPARRNPYFNQICEREDMDKGFWQPIISDDYIRSQDAPVVYDLNCCIYVYSRRFMMSNRVTVFGYKTGIYVMPPESFCDIDTELDWFLATKLMEKYGHVVE
jgi:CMP-N-acetylneuraminic acid synthetase